VNHMARHRGRVIGRLVAAGAGVAAASYAAFAATAWSRYGRVRPPAEGEQDPLLDRFMPQYEIVERHHIRVEAPADLTFDALRHLDMSRSPIVRAIFKGRELVLRSSPVETGLSRELVAQMLALGWGILAEVPGREVIVGAVTKPWEANVVFRALPPADFAAFNEPGFVKIVWTLRADPIDERASFARTETRAIATDAEARRRFRRYWSVFSPGILLIRRSMMPIVKADAERKARAPQTNAAPNATEDRTLAAVR
jgi:hypothetical protein